MSLSADSRYPCLLDRLTGLIRLPERVGDHPSSHGVVTAEKYRAAVLCDLQWLLNSSSHPRLEEDPNGGPPRATALYSEDEKRYDRRKNPGSHCYPQVVRSVINYGLRSLAGRDVHGEEKVLAQELERTILAFEPRFAAVKVTFTRHNLTDPGKLAFGIEAQLKSLPGLKTVHYRSDYDLHTGGCEITEQP